MIFICVLFIFRFYCLPVFLLISQFLVYQRNPFRITLRYSIVSGHNGVGGGGEGGRGGGGPHCVKKRILNSFCNLNIVGCLPLKELYKEGRGPGVTGIPGPLVPNLAPV